MNSFPVFQAILLSRYLHESASPSIDSLVLVLTFVCFSVDENDFFPFYVHSKISTFEGLSFSSFRYDSLPCTFPFFFFLFFSSVLCELQVAVDVTSV